MKLLLNPIKTFRLALQASDLRATHHHLTRLTQHQSIWIVEQAQSDLRTTTIALQHAETQLERALNTHMVQALTILLAILATISTPAEPIFLAIAGLNALAAFIVCRNPPQFTQGTRK